MRKTAWYRRADPQILEKTRQECTSKTASYRFPNLRRRLRLSKFTTPSAAKSRPYSFQDSYSSHSVRIYSSSVMCNELYFLRNIARLESEANMKMMAHPDTKMTRRLVKNVVPKARSVCCLRPINSSDTKLSLLLEKTDWSASTLPLARIASIGVTHRLVISIQ